MDQRVGYARCTWANGNIVQNIVPKEGMGRVSPRTVEKDRRPAKGTITLPP